MTTELLALLDRAETTITGRHRRSRRHITVAVLRYRARHRVAS
jgi:hypothetical protein